MACAAPALIDAHGRTVRYLRLSVTDRCDLRCRYCMGEDMTFLPRDRRLSADEIVVIAERFVARGVRTIRLTGGEPLVRADIGAITGRIGAMIGRGLEELTLTTNATRLAGHARMLADAGVRRINVSLDSLDPTTFRAITRHGDLDAVLGGIEAARTSGLAVRINMVPLAGINEHEAPAMLDWCAERGFDLALIEAMPLGEIADDRFARFVPASVLIDRLRERHTLLQSTHRTSGPARYFQVAGSATRVGVISPITDNFCGTCNRVRVTAEGMLHACLGDGAGFDLRAAIASGGEPALDAAIDAALGDKPQRHAFAVVPGGKPALARHMSVTGG